MSTILPLNPEGAKLSELRNDGVRFCMPKKRVCLGDAPAEIMLSASMDGFDCIPIVGEVNTLIGREVDERNGSSGRPLSV